MAKFGFTLGEGRAVAGIGALYFLRIIGLFLLYPVLAVYASKLPNSSPLLVGLALGIYGLAQAILQIPFGMLSDKFGRRPIIAIGLGFFLLGSLIAGSFTHIAALIIGRLVQGAGAISAVCTALIGDLVASERRSKAMACIGITIGLAFSLSLVLGPLLVVHLGLSGMFMVLAILAALALLVLHFAIPTSERSDTQAGDTQSLRTVFRDWQVCRIALGVGILHAILAAMFMVVPLQIIELTGAPLEQHVQYYLVGIFLSFAMVFPLLGVVERRSWQKSGIMVAVGLLALALLLLWQFASGIVIFFVALAMFFLAFNFLEASLPAMMTRVAPAARRGAAMGFYSTCQFFGIFLGGIVAGIVLHYFTATTLYFTLMWSAVFWLIMYNYNGIRRSHGQSGS
jgi:MFS family permease